MVERWLTGSDPAWRAELRRKDMLRTIAPRWPLPTAAPDGVSDDAWSAVRDILAHGPDDDDAIIARYGIDLPRGVTVTGYAGSLIRLLRDRPIGQREVVGANAVIQAGLIFADQFPAATDADLRLIRDVGQTTVRRLRVRAGMEPPGHIAAMEASIDQARYHLEEAQKRLADVWASANAMENEHG